MPRPDVQSTNHLPQLSRDRWLLLADDPSSAQLHALREQLNSAARAGTTPVLIEVNCSRLGMRDAVLLYDTIRFLPIPVVGLLNGTACVEAVAVLQACAQRVATSTSTVTLQLAGTTSALVRVSSETRLADAIHDAERQLESNCWKRETLSKLLASRARCSPTRLEAITGASVPFVGIGEAVADGLFDEIVLSSQLRRQ